MKVSVWMLAVAASHLVLTPAHSALPKALLNEAGKNLGVETALNHFLKNRDGTRKAHNLRELRFDQAADTRAAQLKALVEALKTAQSEVTAGWGDAPTGEAMQKKLRVQQIFKALDRIANRVKLHDGEKLRFLQIAEEAEFPIVREIREVAYEALRLSLIEGSGGDAGKYSLDPEILTRFEGARTGEDGLAAHEIRDWASMAYRLLSKEQRKALKEMVRYDSKRKKLLYPDEAFAP